MNKLLKNKKNQKGAVSTVVLFTIIMFIIILTGVYTTVTLNAKVQLQSDSRIQELYGKDVDNIDDIYIVQEAILKDGYNKKKYVNSPKILSGMHPIKYDMPTEDRKGGVIATTINDNEWYEYGSTYETRKWANTQTEDGSMWVWIPRYAYRINEEEGTVDVKFLVGTTDFYFNDEGKLEKAQRAKQNRLNVNTKGKNYTVHPAFTDESSIDYVNGGWDKELTGIWVAKFEAGYASGNNRAPVVASEESYENNNSNQVYVAGVERSRNADGSIKSDGLEIARNWLDGMYGNSGSANIKIKYPTFQPLTYSMNYITSSEAYRISKALTGNNNIYGLNSENTDSHLMKNSEWGAVAYLTQSIYGKNSEIATNNATLNSGGTPRTSTQGKTGVDSVYAVTGCTSNSTSVDAKKTTIEKINNVSGNTATTDGIYVWDQLNGQNASSSGNIYGIYDLSGGISERTANFVSNGNGNINAYGKELKEETGASGTNTGISTKYVTIYPSNDAGITNLETAGRANYKNYANNTNIYGDAMREITDAKAGSDTAETGWNTSAGSTFVATYRDYSIFPGSTSPLFARGGGWYSGSSAGMFAFNYTDGYPNYLTGFRTVLVSNE